MSDIVERLRVWPLRRGYSEGSIRRIMRDAADEIEKLRAERRAMQGALLAIKAHTQDAHPMSYMDELCRIARAALGEKE
jgi:hypothetical protein